MTTVLQAEFETIHKSLWDIETAATKAGVSQFKSHVKATKFLKRYAMKLHRQYRLRQSRGWSEKRLEKFAARWNVQSGISAIRYEVERRDLLKSKDDVAKVSESLCKSVQQLIECETSGLCEEAKSKVRRHLAKNLFFGN